MDDAQLLRRYAEEGSQSAFSELVGRYLNLVHSAAMRQVGGDFHRAKDVAQLVFADLARKAQPLSHHPNLMGWLYTSASFAAMKLMRAERRRQAREEGAHAMYDEFSPNPDWNQLQPVIDGVMLELNESDRAAILWRFFDAQPLAVVGAKLGVSEDTARKRVERALDKMHGSLTKRGVASSAAALALMLANQGVIAAPAGLADSVTAAALSSAAGAGASSFAFWEALGTAKSIIGLSGGLWVSATLGIFGIGAAAYELWTAQRAQASLAAATLGYENQMDRLRSLESSVREAKQNQTGVPAGARPAEADPVALGRKFLARFPRASALLTEVGMAEAARKNAPFFRQEHLTPDQIKQFETMMVATWVANVVVTPTNFGAGVVYPTEDQIGQLLGEPVAQRYENYLQTQDAYQLTDWIATSLGAIGVPPSSDQTDHLAQIMEANSSFYKNGAAMDKNAMSLGTFVASVDWDGFGAQAKIALSTAQWEAAQYQVLDMEVWSALAKAQSQSAL